MICAGNDEAVSSEDLLNLPGDLEASQERAELEGAQEESTLGRCRTPGISAQLSFGQPAPSQVEMLEELVRGGEGQAGHQEAPPAASPFMQLAVLSGYLLPHPLPLEDSWLANQQSSQGSAEGTGKSNSIPVPRPEQRGCGTSSVKCSLN